MTLPSSPPISARLVNVELGRAAQAAFSMNASPERTLAGRITGQIALSDFYGKTQGGGGGGGNTFQYLGGGGQVDRSIGTPAANRRVIVIVTGSTSGGAISFTSVNVGGVEATVHASSGHFGGGSGVASAIASAIVPTGTTATITVNGSTNFASPTLYVGYDIGAVYDANTTEGRGATEISWTITSPTNGYGFAIIAGSQFATAVSLSGSISQQFVAGGAINGATGALSIIGTQGAPNAGLSGSAVTFSRL